jgi:hypothetical protein
VPSTVDLATPDQEMPLPITDLIKYHTPDVTIEDTIDNLANKLAVLCIEQFKEDLNLGGGNDNIDQEAFQEELQVRDSRVIRK